MVSQKCQYYRKADFSGTGVTQYHQGPVSSCCVTRLRSVVLISARRRQEWVFPTGWFLMAYLMFDRIAGEGKEVGLVDCHVDPNRPDLRSFQNPEYTFHHISQILLKHREHVANDAWRGLPELTNSSEWCVLCCYLWPELTGLAFRRLLLLRFLPHASMECQYDPGRVGGDASSIAERGLDARTHRKEWL